jgi:hypothetical protein
MNKLYIILNFLVLFATLATASGNQWIPKSHITTGRPIAMDGPSVELVALEDDSDSLEEVRPLVSEISRGGGGDKEEGKATIFSSVFNLVNNVAGAGILTLAAGMASGTGLIPAMLVCAVLGLLSGHCFSIIGEACELTGEPDFKVRILKRSCLTHFFLISIGFLAGSLGSNDWKEFSILGRCYNCCHVLGVFRDLLWNSW